MKNQNVTPMTSNDLRLTTDPTDSIYIEGLKLMFLHEFHGQVI